MNQPGAIAGTLSGYRTMADGTLRLTVDLSEFQSRGFHDLFPAVHCLVAIAPLLPSQVSETPP